MDQMHDYFDALTAEQKSLFSAIASYVFTLGYKARKDKTESPGYTFVHSRQKKHILRFTADRGKPVLKLKFFAAPDYSSFFQEAIRTVIEECNYRYTGCYGCGKCGGTEGYTYKYPEGREYYRCGSELIEITKLESLPLAETLELLKKQHEYYLSHLAQA